MNGFVVLLFCVIFASCSTIEHKQESTHIDFIPYYVDFIENYKDRSSVLVKKVNDIPIQYDEEKYAQNYAAYCKINPDLNKRIIKINRKYWDIAGKLNERTQFINSVMIACGSKEGMSYNSYGDRYLTPFSNWH